MKWSDLFEIRFGSTLLFAAFAAASAFAQDSTNAPAKTAVAIESQVAEALQKNPELKFYEAEIVAARAGRRIAGQFPNPELSGSVGQKSVRSADLRAEGIAWSASLMQPFEWPGRIGLRKAIANRDIELAELGYARFKTALAARVRAAGHTYFGAQSKAVVAQEVASRLRELREVLVQRDPAGLTPLLETRVIEATELAMQRKASEAILASKTALLELNQLRGVGVADSITIEEPRIQFLAAPAADTLVAAALTNNFEIRSRVVELAQQGFRVRLAKNERFERFSVGPMISEERAGDRERVVAVGVSIPVPIWNRNSGNIESAKARQAQAETGLFVTQREVERKVVEAALRYETKVGEINKWRPDTVEHFREAAELADRHYRLGAVPVSTYIELQNQYLEAVEGILDTRREAIEAAGEIELTTGLSLPLVGPAQKESAK